MTVKELIEKLNKFDPNMDVLINGEEYGAYEPCPKLFDDFENNNGGKTFVALA